MPDINAARELSKNLRDQIRSIDAVIANNVAERRGLEQRLKGVFAEFETPDDVAPVVVSDDPPEDAEEV